MKFPMHRINLPIMRLVAVFIILDGGILLGQSKYYSILIGLEYLDPGAYEVEYGNEATSGVPSDLIKMNEIAVENDHIVTILKNEKATKSSILRALREVGQQIEEDDYFLLYFSGHGDTIRDLNNDEPSGYDQVLVSYDKHILDDEIDDILAQYFSKTKNIMIIDACHSSTSYKFAEFDIKSSKVINKYNAKSSKQLALLSEELDSNCLYDSQSDVSKNYSLIYYGATRDDSTAGGDSSGGVLTNWLYYIYDKARYENMWDTYTYESFACEISLNLPDYSQILQFHKIGKNTFSYINSNPFKLD